MKLWPSLRERLIGLWHGLLDYDRKIPVAKREKARLEREAAKHQRLVRDAEKDAEKRARDYQMASDADSINSDPRSQHHQGGPSGMQYWGDFQVAGTNYEGRRDILRRLARPENESCWELFLQQEPENPHDPKAIAVHGKMGRRSFHLGYVPKQIAAEVSNYRKIAVALRSVGSDGGYLYLDLWFRS